MPFLIFISLCQDIRKSKGKNRKFINRLSAVHIFQKRIVIMEKTPNRPICQSIRCLCSEFLFYYYLLLFIIIILWGNTPGRHRYWKWQRMLSGLRFICHLCQISCGSIRCRAFIEMLFRSSFHEAAVSNIPCFSVISELVLP